MAWLALIAAGCFEIVGVAAMNQISRKRAIGGYVVLVLGFATSFLLLSYAMSSIAMGTAYAIWTGIGTVGSAIVGILFFHESRQWQRLLFIAMILSAAVGLKLIS